MLLSIANQGKNASANSPGSLIITDLGLYSIAGESLESIMLGQQAMVRVSIESLVNTGKEFVILVQIWDSNGITVDIA